MVNISIHKKNKHKEREKETDRRNAPDICYFVSLVEKQTM